MIAILLAITPFLFYLYKYAPQESSVWETPFFKINGGGFVNVQAFVHAVVTKLTFILITMLWFISSRDWWKWAILIPLVMFLFQFFGVINFQQDYVDDFDFWYALPVITPVIIVLIWISHELNRVVGDLDLKDEIEDELKQYDEERF
ncbi:hypothetical protein EAX61_09175 [Dokdonia sinensis]|uniref:DUF4293 family protein n=1 Tax=Dokdonia sinensis TaxID=2479847 RepID=A0A3M0GPM2_9FLAO|nr:hypothetical protein EAX61_09175 [Dokdonia sinensis]